jgi:hypothetical protein
MNKNIRNLNLEEILFFDIETVRRNKVLDVNSKEFELYSWSIRDKTTGYVPPSNEVVKHYENNGALKPEFNKIVVISVGYIKDNTLYYKAITGTQKEIITEFYKVVTSTGFSVCGHNIKGFDIPITRIKVFEEGLDLSIIPDRIMDSGKKPWDLDKSIIDTMDIIKGTYFYSMSLDAACMLKGIESSKDDISGAYVSQVYYQEGVDRIATYCNKDVIATARLFCSLQGKDDFISEFIDKGLEVLKEKQVVSVLDHIISSGELSSKNVKGLVNFTIENKLDKKEVFLIVKAALSNSGKVLEEDIAELESELGLKVDYSLIECVAKKGNLGKVELDKLLKKYGKSSKKDKKAVIDLVEQYLTTFGKINQSRAANSLKMLKEKL